MTRESRSPGDPHASLIIDGEAVAGADSFDVVNPATGESFATAPEASPGQLDDAFHAADRAFRSWRDDDDFRRSKLAAAADALTAATERIAPVLTAEQGKPLFQSRREIAGAVGWLRYFAELEVPGAHVLQDDERAYAEAVRVPLGVVATIVPWNSPVYIGVAKVAMALRAGNTVVMKPSPYTPLAALMVGETLRGILPKGVLNVISGRDHLGPLVTAHPLVRKISFTGSTATGRSIAAATVGRFTRLTLEMGGNDAAIVLADADIASTAQGLFTSAFGNTGQACVAPKRIYVADSLYEPLTEALVELARDVRVGDGMDPETVLGPLNNLPQRDRVAGLVEDALAMGGKALVGGAVIERPGYFYQPTIITGVTDGTRLVDEEQFGPALPVMPFSDIDDAVARANNTDFGLGSSVWGTDLDRAAAVASRLEAGSTWINTHIALAPHQPFAGWKSSGVGVEGGQWGLDSFTEVKTLYTSRT